MTLRNITPEDRELYLELSKGFYTGDATLHPANFTFINRTFDECISDSPFAKAYILEEAGKPAGFALFSFTWSNESGGMVALLEELYVAPEYRGMRLGTQFMDWMLLTFKDMTRIRLEVCHCNSGARRLYERYGFTLLDYEQMVLDKETNA